MTHPPAKAATRVAYGPASVEALVEIDDLTVAYGDGPPVLRGIDLRVERGAFVVLAGASGSGKTTLLGTLCGLVPHATGGTVGGVVRVGRHHLRTSGPRELGAVCGYVGQDPERQVVMTTVGAELALGPQLRGASGVAVRRAVEEVALALGLADRLDRDLRTLSGGELQRVALGAALTQQPELLVLDEPTSQLDPVAGDELLGLLRRLNEEWGLTVILAEHRLERCLGAADRVVALSDGLVAFDGDPGAFCGWAATGHPAVATSAAQVLGDVDPPLAAEAVTVRRARAALAGRGLLNVGSVAQGAAAAPGPATATAAAYGTPPRRVGRPRRRPAGADAALRCRGLWRELGGDRSLLRGIDLEVAPGEAVALMGRNGAGKTTLLRVLAGLDRPDRGRVDAAGRVALLMQRSADHLLHERVADELPDGVTAASIGLTGGGLASRNPRDLSGGERQLLATAVVSGGDPPPAVLCLDEPTRGLDRDHRRRLASELRRRREQGTATIVATHDPEFAAAVAGRVVLLGRGVVLADGPLAEILEGGWYFATEMARVLQTPGIVTAAAARAELRARAQAIAIDRDGVGR